MREPYGVMARFPTANALIAASQKIYAQGYRDIDTFTPYPIEELESLATSQFSVLQRPVRNVMSVFLAKLLINPVGLCALVGGIGGGVIGYYMQYYAAVIDYPINIGGRPLHSWPAFVPVTFALTVLCSALMTALGMILINGLPSPYHPVFNCPEFSLNHEEPFFLMVNVSQFKFQVPEIVDALKKSGAVYVAEVEP